MIFKMYLDGHSIDEICAEMTQKGFQTRDRNEIWNHRSIAYILKNEKYIGDSLLQKRFTTDTLPFVKKKNNGEKERYYVERSHPPIIDREIFETDSNYYGAVASQHIRAILQNAYPFVTIDEMKASLKAGGLSADFVDELTCAELIPGVGESLSEVPTAVETINIVSVYPKNETVPPPEEDAETETIVCNGVQYAVVPVVVDGSQLILTTDENGWTISPDLSCGLYYLVETKTPAGYNMLEEAVSVSVTSSVMTEITTIRIANQRGHLLPETGGEGREAPGFILVLRHTQQAGASFCRKSTRLGFLRDECGQKGNIGRQTQKNYQKTAKILTLPKQRGII